jgi:hypothetical protein
MSQYIDVNGNKKKVLSVVQVEGVSGNGVTDIEFNTTNGKSTVSYGDGTTQEKDYASGIIGAVNTAQQTAQSAQQTVGDLADLDTTNKDSAVDAINEVNNDLDALSTQKIGNLADLSTENKTSIVGAINEANGANHKIGDLNDLNTYYKDTLVNAINEVNGKVDTKQDKLTQVTDLTPTMQIRSLTANTRYTFGTLTSLDITFPATATDGDQIIVGFVSDEATTLELDMINAFYNFVTIKSNAIITLTAIYNLVVQKWVVEVDDFMPIDAVLENNSWAVIKYVCRAGMAHKYWQIGDTKNVTLADGYTYQVRLSDMTAGRYAYADGSGSSNNVFEFVKCLPDGYGMNSAPATNIGGFAASEMRTYLNSTVFDLLPDDLKAVIAEVTIYSGDGDNLDTVTASNNKLFLASAYEIAGSDVQHDYYKTAEGSSRFEYYVAHPYSYQRTKTNVNSEDNIYYWLRTPYKTSSTSFLFVTNGGGIGVYVSYDRDSVCPFFVL